MKEKDIIIDESCFEREDELNCPEDYYESNEDECYEFGGTTDDRETYTKSLCQDMKEATPFLVLGLLFCIGVFWFSFHYVH